MTPLEILNQAAAEMDERASYYDGDQGERSMAQTVAAFNAITGHNMSESEGWAFMQCLKLVRANNGAYRPDNYVDSAAYAALAGECAATKGVP